MSWMIAQPARLRSKHEAWGVSNKTLHNFPKEGKVSFCAFACRLFRPIGLFRKAK